MGSGLVGVSSAYWLREAAREIWEFSIGICHEVHDTIKILGSMGFENHYVDAAKLRQLGFKNVHGARFEAGSAQAHPMKFRNGVLQNWLDNGLA